MNNTIIEHDTCDTSNTAIYNKKYTTTKKAILSKHQKSHKTFDNFVPSSSSNEKSKNANKNTSSKKDHHATPKNGSGDTNAKNFLPKYR